MWSHDQIYVIVFISVEHHSCNIKCNISIYNILLNSDWLLRISLIMQCNIILLKHVVRRKQWSSWHHRCLAQSEIICTLWHHRSLAQSDIICTLWHHRSLVQSDIICTLWHHRCLAQSDSICTLWHHRSLAQSDTICTLWHHRCLAQSDIINKITSYGILP